MKALSELGISPAPWEWNEKHPRIVWNGENLPLVNGIRPSDARLIAAAPKLYNELYWCVQWCEAHMTKRDGIGMDLVTAAKAALAEAAGEEVAK